MRSKIYGVSFSDVQKELLVIKGADLLFKNEQFALFVKYVNVLTGSDKEELAKSLKSFVDEKLKKDTDKVDQDIPDEILLERQLIDVIDEISVQEKKLEFLREKRFKIEKENHQYS